jgi:nucleoside-diphosphate-sugar epimerase
MVDSRTSIPKGSWILVTGANGFVASHIVRQFLERGYKVRGTVRDLERSSWLTQRVFKTYADTGYFELVHVADLGVEHAFDNAVEGVSAIAHVASIVSFDPNPHRVVPPVVASVTSLLDAAKKEPSVKEFVFTSSVVAVTMPTPDNKAHVGSDTYNDLAVQLAWAPPPYDPSRGFAVYMASKTEAEKALWKWCQEKSPHFTVNSVWPVGIIGEFLNNKHAESAAAWLKIIYDGKAEVLAGFPASTYRPCKMCLFCAGQSLTLSQLYTTTLRMWLFSMLRRYWMSRSKMPGYRYGESTATGMTCSPSCEGVFPSEIGLMTSLVSQNFNSPPTVVNRLHY